MHTANIVSKYQHSTKYIITKDDRVTFSKKILAKIIFYSFYVCMNPLNAKLEAGIFLAI